MHVTYEDSTEALSTKLLQQDKALIKKQNHQFPGSGEIFQNTKRSFEEKFGSLVRLTPSRRNPASSPGVGI